MAGKMGQLTLRDATPADAQLLLGVMLEAFAEYVNVLDPPSGAHLETLDSVCRHLANGAAVIASIGGEEAGFAFYEPVGDLVYFSRLSVLPQFRKRGIGGALLEDVERRAKADGAVGVRLGVRLQLPQLMARYERLGYHLTEYKTHLGYSRPTYVLMEKLWA
jgi:GNAT superfamily N-acetyltransferase